MAMPSTVPADLGPAGYIAHARGALEVGRAGKVPMIEAVCAALVYARIAAGSGDAAAQRCLGEMYVHRHTIAVEQGNAADELLHGSLALFRFDQAADGGDNLASAYSEAIRVSAAATERARNLVNTDYPEEAERDDAICAAAGRGDEEALLAMIADISASAEAGDLTPRETVFYTFTVATLGADFGFASCQRVLGRVFQYLSTIERGEGRLGAAIQAEVAAIQRFHALASANEPGALCDLVHAVEEYQTAALAVARAIPALLTLTPHAGGCH